MALFTATKIAQGQPPISGGQAGVVVCNEGSYEVPATLAGNDIVKLAYLPAGHKPVDVILESDDLDEATALALSVGVVNAGGDDLVANTNFITSSTVGQAGGVARASVVAGLQLAPSGSDRVIGVKVATVATTPAAGTLRLKVLSVPA
jgi:hypothetical protein